MRAVPANESAPPRAREKGICSTGSTFAADSSGIGTEANTRGNSMPRRAGTEFRSKGRASEGMHSDGRCIRHSMPGGRAPPRAWRQSTPQSGEVLISAVRTGSERSALHNGLLWSAPARDRSTVCRTKSNIHHTGQGAIPPPRPYVQSWSCARASRSSLAASGEDRCAALAGQRRPHM